MNDIELTRLCAEAKGLSGIAVENGCVYYRDADGPGHYYDPLLDGGQALDLAEMFKIRLDFDGFSRRWYATDKLSHLMTHSADIKRAIATCVARLHAAKISESRGN